MTNKEWGFWIWSVEEWGVHEYDDNLDGGPYKTFNEAKKALKKFLNKKAKEYKNAAGKVDELKEPNV